MTSGPFLRNCDLISGGLAWRRAGLRGAVRPGPRRGRLARLARRGVRCRSLALVGWQISANLGGHVRAGADARGWRWEITRGADVAQVVVEVSGRAWSADPVSLPDDTRRALESDGRAGPLKVLGRDKPPRVIRCVCSGCLYLAAGEAGEWPSRP
jgi:hypothetical protein